MCSIHYKGTRAKSNVIKRNVEKVWGARYTLGARYLPKNTVHSEWKLKTIHPVVSQMTSPLSTNFVYIFLLNIK
jgi:hypothetical protein